MSSVAMNFAFKAKVPSKAKVILINLADASDKYGRARFSLASLANDCDFSIMETRALLQQLADDKLIMLEPGDKLMHKHDSWQQALIMINRNSGEVHYESN